MEAGHRCAISTCRHIHVEVHHIIPWSKCQRHEYENLIALCPNCHARADQGEIDKKALTMYKNKLRFLHDKYSNFEVDFLFELGKKENTGLHLPNSMYLSVIRIFDAGYCDRIPSDFFKINGVEAGLDRYVITDKGREFISDIQNPRHDF